MSSSSKAIENRLPDGQSDTETPGNEDLAELVASTTTTLDDVCDAVFDDNLAVFDAEAAAMIALQVSARLMGKAVGTLVQVSNNHEIVRGVMLAGLEKGVGRSIDRTMVCTYEGRNLVDFVRVVTDRFIETAAAALSVAVATVPTGANSGSIS